MTRTVKRAVVAVALGLVAAKVALDHARLVEPQRDFTQLWFAARALWRGENPYLEIGHGLAYDWPAPLVYPLPAAIAAMPLAWLPQDIANAVFMFIGATAFAYALTRQGWGPLLGFFSGSMLVAVEIVQWSPLFAAATVVPVFGIVLATKPTIGAAIFAARPSWWAIGGGLLLVLAAFLFDPLWLLHWRDALARNAAIQPPNAPYVAPISFPGGLLVLTALLRWRRPEARLIAVLATVPQTMLPYETVPLFIIATAWHEALLLMALSWGALVWLVSHVDPTDYRPFLATSGPVMVLMLYLPATLMVLRRPNEGTVPAWLERAAARWPAWLRGSPASATDA